MKNKNNTDIKNKGEKLFYDMMTAKGLTLIEQPYISGLKMKPDFYCIEEKAYYEVINNSQAYYHWKPKIPRARDAGVNLKIVHPDGSTYIPRQTSKRPSSSAPNNRLKILRTGQHIRQFTLAQETHINPATLSMIENKVLCPTDEEKARIARVLKVRIKEIWPR